MNFADRSTAQHQLARMPGRPSRLRGGARSLLHPARRTAPLLLAILLACTALSCDQEITLVEPADFFDFDPSNTWPECNVPGGAPLQHHVPPPSGISVFVCPNPAPAGTREMLFRFTLQIDARVNLAILDDRGRIVRELLVNANLGTNIERDVIWNIKDQPPGDYRAYLRAGSSESNSDLRIEP